MKTKKCPVCNAYNNQYPVKIKNYWECKGCKSFILNESKYSNYSKKYYFRGSHGWWMKIIDYFSFWDRFVSAGVKVIDKILEIGFGEGKFLKELTNRKYDVFGVDVSNFARNNISRYIGKDKVFGKIFSINEQFDIIFMFHVLEHIESPAKYISLLRRFLKSDGRLIIRIPIIDSWEAELAGEDWYHLDYPNHKVLFSETGIIKMLKQQGYTDIKLRKNMLEYRQVLGYSILSALKIKLPKWLMILYQIFTIPILWIVSALMHQHGVLEIQGTIHNANNNT